MPASMQVKSARVASCTWLDTLGYPLAMEAGPANEQDRDHVAPLVEQVQDETGGTVEVAYADQGYTGENAAKAAEVEGGELVVVKHNPEGQGFIVLPNAGSWSVVLAGSPAAAVCCSTSNA